MEDLFVSAVEVEEDYDQQTQNNKSNSIISKRVLMTSGRRGRERRQPIESIILLLEELILSAHIANQINNSHLRKIIRKYQSAESHFNREVNQIALKKIFRLNMRVSIINCLRQ
jgi:hypothetical protein